MPNQKRSVPLVTVFAAVLALACGARSQQTAGSGAQFPAGNQAVHSITLPQYSPQIPPGPHEDDYRAHCLICHSARYVMMQPRFSRTVWENEVKKMVAAYGAVIAEADQKKIVEYLMAVRGTEEKGETKSGSPPQ